MIRRLVAAVLLAGVVGAVVVAFYWGDDFTATNVPEWAQPAPFPDERQSRPQGGRARVAVLTPPEFMDQGDGGDTLRQLTLPSLFAAYPDGTYRASLVVPGSDGASADGRHVYFRLRPARWSNGAPISADDLRRTADPRFVESVSGPNDDGVITVALKQKLPGWRRLWSEGIDPPAAEVTGGPFNVASVESGLQTVLRRNDEWFPEGRPNLDEVDLVLAADVVLARLLLRDDKVDVYRAIEDTVRTRQLLELRDVEVAVDERSGIHAGLRLDNGDLTVEQRRLLAASLPKSMFVKSLLNDEAFVSNGLAGYDVWAGLSAGDGGLEGARVGFSAPAELPLTPLAAATVSHAVEQAGGIFDGGGGPDVLLDRRQDGPVICWTCRFGLAEPELAAAADTGDEAAIVRLQERLRDQGRFLPLWRPKEVVAWRDGQVAGVVPNGFSYGNAWNAERWYRPD